MPVTLADLLAEEDLDLRLLVGRTHVPVSWAHSSDLVDPTPFLETGNLVLTTGTQFAEDATAGDYDRYVERLAAVGVAAVGFGTEVARSGTPALLVEACDRNAVGLVEVPFRTPFLAVVRRIADARAAQEHARDVWTLEAQRSLSLAALSRDRIGAVLDELALRLGAAVVLLDAAGETLSRHGRRRLPAAADEAVRTEARRMLQRRLRSGSAVHDAGLVISLQTLGRKDELRGVLAVAVDARPDAAATAVITSAVALAEFAVEDAARRRSSTLALNAELLELASSGALDPARRVAAAGARRLPEAPVTVVQILLDEVDAGELEQAVTVRAGGVGRSALAARWHGTFAVVVEEAAARTVAELLATRSRTVVLAAVGDWPQVPRTLREGEAALRLPQPAGVVEPARAPLFGLLSRAEVTALAEHRLEPLRTAPDGSELRRMLQTWLSHDTAWEPAARELGLHRHTLKAHVHRAGQLLDLDLDTFDGKAELWALLQTV